MVKKIVLGGLVAGVVMFAWGSLAHLVLGLGEVGVRQLPMEDTVIQALTATAAESGLYMFPMEGYAQQAAEWEQKYRQGPVGLLVVNVDGAEPMSVVQLLSQFLTYVAACWVAAYLLIQAAPNLKSFPARVAFVMMLGFFGWLIAVVPYWNWYGFPTNYTLARLVEHVLGWILGGIVLSAFVTPSSVVSPSTQPVQTPQTGT